MPLLKTSDRDLVRIDLPTPGEWVEVKARLGRDDEREIQRRMLRGQNVKPGEVPEAFDLGLILDAATFCTLEVAIKAWSFSEPVTAENLRALDDASIDAINRRLNELYPEQRTEAAKNGSSGSGQTTEPGEAPLPLSSTGSL